jgi:hypothetical protein
VASGPFDSRVVEYFITLDALVASLLLLVIFVALPLLPVAPAIYSGIRMSALTAKATQRWVAAWYAPPCRMVSAGLAGRRLRQIVRVHASGQELRLHLSNRYGNEPVTLASISVAKSIQGPVVGEDSAQVTFEGLTDVVLEPGAEKNSDPVSIDVEAFSSLAISFDLVQGEAQTGHLFASQTSFISAKKAEVTVPTGFTFMEYPLMTSSWWLIAGLHVVPSAPVNVLVAFGSSTTDGLDLPPIRTAVGLITLHVD